MYTVFQSNHLLLPIHVFIFSLRVRVNWRKVSTLTVCIVFVYLSLQRDGSV